MLNTVQGSRFKVQGFEVEQLPCVNKVLLRSLDTFELLNQQIAPILGCKLSETPNTVVEKNDIRAFWWRPHQWLITCSSQTIYQSLEKALTSLDSSVIEVTDGYTVTRLSGEKARAVLQKGCPLDVHPCEFPTGSMARTRIAQTDILLHCLQASEKDSIYEIYTRLSFSDYLLEWLNDSGIEYRA